MSEIILRDICKSYENGFQAVKNFNLEIEKGELVVFVGPSDAESQPHSEWSQDWKISATVNYGSETNWSTIWNPKERNLAMVFQSYALYPQMNIYDNIAFSLQVSKSTEKEIVKEFTMWQNFWDWKIC